MAEPVRILAIDGGGIRGIIPATVLTDLETRTGRAAAELFDLIAGTSTGGILALGLTVPGEQRRPAHRASDLVELYVREGPNVFHRSIFDRIRSLEGAIDERYPAEGLERVLRSALGEAPLSEALTDVLVTAYDTDRRQPFFFRSSRARGDAASDYPMHVAARATASAPTYFEAARVVNPASGDEYSLVDGGLFAANPAMVGLAEVLRAERERPVILLSLGTGQHTRRYPWKEIKDWGAQGCQLYPGIYLAAGRRSGGRLSGGLDEGHAGWQWLLPEGAAAGSQCHRRLFDLTERRQVRSLETVRIGMENDEASHTHLW